MLQKGDPAPPFEARPVSGLPVVCPPASGLLVLCFVRHLGSPFARQTLAELQGRFADFDRAGARVVAISHCGLTTARDFVPRHHLLFPLVADVDGALHKRFGLGHDRWFIQTMKGVARIPWRRTVRALRQGVGATGGPIRQLSAEFVVGRDGRLAHASYACHVFAGPDLDALLAVVGGA